LERSAVRTASAKESGWGAWVVCDLAAPGVTTRWTASAAADSRTAGGPFTTHAAVSLQEVPRPAFGVWLRSASITFSSSCFRSFRIVVVSPLASEPRRMHTRVVHGYVVHNRMVM